MITERRTPSKEKLFEDLPCLPKTITDYTHGFYNPFIILIYIRHRPFVIPYITGDITNISFKDILELSQITQWECLHLIDGKSVFSGCRNLYITARDIPNLKDATDLSEMFKECKSITGTLNMWNTEETINSSLIMWDVKNITIISNIENRTFVFSITFDKIKKVYM